MAADPAGLRAVRLTLWGVIWYRSRSLSPAAMLKRLPTDDAVVVYIDFARFAQRPASCNCWTAPRSAKTPSTGASSSKTDFDYKQDLDAAMVAFAPKGKYMLLKGRFDWKSLKSYVPASDGSCNNSFCKLAGSTPERQISFFPMQSNLMAMAVSNDDVGGATHEYAWTPRPTRKSPTRPSGFRFRLRL